MQWIGSRCIHAPVHLTSICADQYNQKAHNELFESVNGSVDEIELRRKIDNMPMMSGGEHLLSCCRVAVTNAINRYIRLNPLTS